MPDVTLLGLDFGTTTSSAVIASARLARNAVSGKVELSQVSERFRSDIVFTPLDGDHLDEAKLSGYLDTWLAGAPGEIFGGGALLTGLTAQKENATTLVKLIRQRVKGALVASAHDPCLESWLAFMGNCAALSRNHPDRWLLNLDIGGGTTNLALGRNGEVVATGCLFVGARHFQVEPGTYRIVRVSTYARRLLDHLGIAKGPGQELVANEVSQILDFYLRLLLAAAAADNTAFAEPAAALHQQVPLRAESIPGDIVLTLSGGVGELVYSALAGKSLPPRTHFGDLGIDLAQRILDFAPWRHQFRELVPSGGGRATVFGLLRHSTQISGSTIFLGEAKLPLTDLPIVGTITERSPESQIAALLDLAKRSPAGAALFVCLQERSQAAVRDLGMTLARMLRTQAFPVRHPLVLLIADNLGKVLGNYVTDWGASPRALVVVDEIEVRDAQYVHLGAPHQQVIPISFHGLQP